MTCRLFKQHYPWSKPVYSNVDCVFKEARGQLFSNLNNGLKGKNREVVIAAPGNVNLNGLWVQNERRGVILFVPGINCLYEEAAEPWIVRPFIDFFQRTFSGVDVLIVNPRGVAASEGVSTRTTLKVDLFCSFQFLVNQGFDPNKIISWGHSLGGARALLAGALAQKEYPDKKINVVTDRSFLSLQDVVKARAPCGGRILANYIDKNWLEIDCFDAAESLKGRVVAIASDEDDTVPYEASFVSKYKTKKQDNYVAINLDKSEPHRGKIYPHTRSLTSDEGAKVVAALGAIFDEKNSEVSARVEEIKS